MDQQAKRTALRMIPCGIYVVGAARGDEINACVATWISQCSFQPPLIMMASKRTTTTHEMLLQSRQCTVNLLGKDQKPIAEQFMRPLAEVGNKFGSIAFHLGATGAPILDEAPAFLECKVLHHIEGGDHDVIVAEVIGAGAKGDAAALLTLEDAGWHYGG